MSQNRLQSGFSITEGIVVAVVVVLIGLVGYRVYDARQNANTATTGSSQAQTELKAPEIRTAKDLDTARQTLDSIETDSDLSSLERDLETF